MRRTLKLSICSIAFVGVLGCVSARNVAQAKTAMISRTDNGHRITYVQQNYSLRRVPSYPTTQLHFHNIRSIGTFRYYWRTRSEINYPFR